MKKMFTKGTALLLSLVLLLCSFTGCDKPPQTDAPEADQTNPTADHTTPGTWYLSQHTEEIAASVELPDFAMEDETLKQLVCDYVNSRLVDCGCDFSLALSNEDVTVQPQDYLYYLDLDCKVTYLTDSFASLVFEGLYNVKSAAHPTNIIFTLNINRTTNERIMLKDIWLLNCEFYETYLPHAEDALASVLGEQSKDVQIDQFVSKEAFLIGLQTETEYCVYYTQTGMVISVPTIYAIGDHLEAEIPYDDLWWWDEQYEPLRNVETEVSLFDGGFTIFRKGRHGWYRCLNTDGEVIREKHFYREQRLTQISDDVVCFTLQAGTGLSTQWGFFYDGSAGACSEIFQFILTATEDKVVLGSHEGITVRSIFDDTYYEKFTSFEHPPAQIAIEWIVDAEFSKDGKSVIVTYMTGENYEKVTQEFALY